MKHIKSLIIIFFALVIGNHSQGQIYQLPNAGFEQWDGSTFSGNNVSEPTGWNSFGSANATISVGASTARQTHHTRNSGHRPGGTGSYYLTIWTKSVNFFVINTKANGNMTTGRIKIGSTTATDLAQNYNYTDRSGGYAQPFDGTPDSMYVWVSYWAASATDQAGITCYLHGDSDFRDPTDNANTSLYCGKAEAQFTRTRGSASGSPVWQQIKVPFVYDGTSSVNYILMTLNTNITPAGGSANDSLSVDDIEFVYSAWLTALSVDGTPLAGFSPASFDYYIEGYTDTSFHGINIGYTREASDATVSIDSVAFSDSYGRGWKYRVHVVAEDQVTTHDYNIYCYVRQTIVEQHNYTVQVLTADETMGLASGGGIYPEGSTATISATPLEHCHFASWNDLSTLNPRTFTVTSDTTFIATFALDQHYLELYTSPSYLGSVSGAGLYAYGDTALISATAPAHFHFVAWSDGSTDNPRRFRVESGTALWALFEIDQHTVLLSAPDSNGTLIGAGTYAYGDIATLQALPAPHYHFSVWSDGSTENPRQITVVSDTAFSAFFALDEHTLALASNPSGSATFAGEGTYPYGTAVQVLAQPHEGYGFVQWADGVTDNPRTLTLLSDTTLTALMQTFSFTLSLVAQPAEGGTLEGTGTYPYGTQATLIATPAEGYHFALWDDSVTANPRTVVVTANATYTALFEPNPDNPEDYLISTATNNPMWGTVAGGGIYQEGTTATLLAQASPNYHFQQWHDGDRHNPRTITVINNATYTATFAPDTHSVALTSLPAQGGATAGAGAYAHAATALLSASAAQGYHFVSWSDGVTLNPRMLCVVSDTALAATFALDEHELAVLSANAAWGTAHGGGVYTHGSQATLSAQPFEGCHFVSWHDGNTQNPRTVAVTAPATYTATFALNQYTIALQASPRQGGTIYGDGIYTHGVTATLLAIPAEGYHFAGWSDSVQDNPRTLTVTGDLQLTALFESTTYTVTVMANVDAWGTTSGGGTYPQGATAVLSAQPSEGYRFLQWNDGETVNPRTISVDADRLFIATFAPTTAYYTITAVANNPEGGTVSGGGTYAEGSQAVLTAEPAEGWRFLQWNDGSKINPRTVTVSSDALFIATFAQMAGILGAEEALLNLYPNPASDYVVVEGSRGEGAAKRLEILDLQGRVVLREEMDALPYRLNISNLPSGTYFLKVGTQVRRLVVR